MARAIAAVTPDGGRIAIAVDDLALLFFDTFMSHLNSQLCPLSRYDHFEYYDEDGEQICVRSDEEYSVFLSNTRQLLEIMPRSTARFGDTERESVGEDSDSLHNECHSKEIRLDELHLINLIDTGQFGSVYKALFRALDARHDRVVALKVIAIDTQVDSSISSSMAAEVAALRTASEHPYIVGFHGAICSENELYICMEFMDGLDLTRYGKLPTSMVGAVAVAIVEALSHLWTRGIMHRDVKPANFLVSSDGLVKLGDFGISKRMLQSVAWTYVGSEAYMSPERVHGQLYGLKSDVWALGISLSELVTGKPPVNNKPSVDYAQSNGSVLDGLEWQEGCLVGEDAALAHFVYDCTIIDPEKRLAPDGMKATPFFRNHSPFNIKVVRDFLADFHLGQESQQLLSYQRIKE